MPMEVRKQRTHVLRDLAQRKNLEFRRSMIGRTLSVVTLEDGRTALSDNYLKVALARPREANRIEEVRIGGLTADGLHEAGMLSVLAREHVRLRLRRISVFLLAGLCGRPSGSHLRLSRRQQLPHNREVFTEGLFYLDGFRYESSG